MVNELFKAVDSAVTKVDAQQCPLCMERNACNVDDAKNCWCMTTEVPKLLIEKIPEEQRNKACICQACINRFNAKLG